MNNKPTNTIQFEAIGTFWTIDFFSTINADKLDDVRAVVKDRINSFDLTYSRFRQDSLVSSIAQSAGTYEFPQDAATLFAFYENLYGLTNGKVTLLVGDLLVQAGYDASYSLQPSTTLTPVRKWESVMTYRHPVLTTTAPVMLDFGAAGKGYLIDIIAKIFDEHNVQSYMIDAGGDMLLKNDEKQIVRVGLENPADLSQAIGVVPLAGGSLCGSAGSRRQWAGYHHIMDPDTAESSYDILATWVMADSALIADGVATALFFTSPSSLRAAYGFEYCIVYPDMRYDISADFPAEMFAGANL